MNLNKNNSCRECTRLRLLIKLKRGEMLHTLCMDTHRLTWLADDINLLEEELEQHMATHALLYAWPPKVEVYAN